jgi:hypothetical protein
MRTSLGVNLDEVAFNLFKRFVVYERGTTNKEVVAFFTECLQPCMTASEIRSFSFKTIEEFLAKPESSIS